MQRCCDGKDTAKENDIPEGKEKESYENGSGKKDGDDPEDEINIIPDRIVPDEILRAGFDEMLSTEEVMDALYSNGCIDLEEGDVFSISVTVTKGHSVSWLGISGKEEKEKFTSGTVIR